MIYHHQACKRADVVLALMLLSSQFTLDDKRRDFDYYEAVTTHDSSLSFCIIRQGGLPRITLSIGNYHLLR